MIRILVVLLSGMLVMIQSGCHARSSVPIVNVDDQAIVREDGKALTAEQVRRAIIIAGGTNRKLTWDISDEKEGHLIAKLVVRGKHTAVADIFYSATRLSIKYRDSINLNFEKDKEGRGLIHSNYNRWVNDLLKAIMIEMQKVE